MPARYDAIEKNLLDFNPTLESRRQTISLQSIARPDRSVVGIMVAPRPS